LNSPDISVIIPVYNGVKYLAEAIESVLAQTLEPLEIIVVDDGSTDRSLEIAGQFLPRVTIVRQENKGAGAARNTGVRVATGGYFAFLDADDLWTPQKLSIQRSLLESHPETDMVFGTVKQFISPELPAEQQGTLRKEMGTMPGYSHGAMLIERTKFLHVGPFSEQLEIGEFIDWFSRARHLGLTHRILDDIVLKRRIHTQNMGIYKRGHLNNYTAILRKAIARKRNQ
jgi:glycosyltransferase involved in cell wall biosynthesis